ncbi:unnamed protein product [Lasius platythorax]|uniref:Uncharacterized protein n=1 Tax=Lasius platythorax TaxID=488582 RepID=A0AAV2NWA3_9HYME
MTDGAREVADDRDAYTDVQRDEEGPRSKKVDKRVASALPLQASSCIDPHNSGGGGGWLGRRGDGGRAVGTRRGSGSWRQRGGE